MKEENYKFIIAQGPEASKSYSEYDLAIFYIDSS